MDKYYVGATSDNIMIRLEKHRNGKYSTSYTAQADDWQLFIHFEVDSYAHTIRIEKKIKSIKSRKYIENLKRYDELKEKLIKKTST